MYLKNIYKVYIDAELLPQTPASISVTNQNKNEEYTMANGRPFTVARYDGAKHIEFEFEITYKEYYVTFSDANRDAEHWKQKLEDLKEKRESFYLTIIRNISNMSTYEVLLDDYSYAEENENADDFTFSVSFTEYHPQNNQELDTEIIHHLILANEASGWVGQKETAQLEAEAQAAEEQANADAQRDANMQDRIQGAVERTDEFRLGELMRISNDYIGYTAPEESSKFGEGAWGAWFVKSCANASKVAFPETGYCPDVHQWAINEGRFTDIPKQGYYILYDWDGNGVANQIGIVKEVTPNGIITIEGNSKNENGENGVWQHVRDDVRVIMGYINPF